MCWRACSPSFKRKLAGAGLVCTFRTGDGHPGVERPTSPGPPSPERTPLYWALACNFERCLVVVSLGQLPPSARIRLSLKGPSEKIMATASSKSNSELTCLIIAPLGEERSATRKTQEAIFRVALRPVLEGLGYTVQRPQDMSSAGSITRQLTTQLLTSDLVVADLTGLNPSVMYELGVRHAVGLPAIVLAEEGTQLPFDIRSMRTLFYRNDLRGAEELRKRLRDAAVHELRESNTKNPYSLSLDEEHSRLARPSAYHVVARGTGWAVQSSGSDRATKLLPTKNAAVVYARHLARRSKADEVIVHNEDGTVDERETL